MEHISEKSILLQALIDGSGYPKSSGNQENLGFSVQRIHKLTDELLDNPNKSLNQEEKQIIINCIDGALDYVGSDIRSLYDITPDQLKDFKDELEKRWQIHSTYTM